MVFRNSETKAPNLFGNSSKWVFYAKDKCSGLWQCGSVGRYGDWLTGGLVGYVSVERRTVFWVVAFRISKKALEGQLKRSRGGGGPDSGFDFIIWSTYLTRHFAREMKRGFEIRAFEQPAGGTICSFEYHNGNEAE